MKKVLKGILGTSLLVGLVACTKEVSKVETSTTTNQTISGISTTTTGEESNTGKLTTTVVSEVTTSLPTTTGATSTSVIGNLTTTTNVVITSTTTQTLSGVTTTSVSSRPATSSQVTTSGSTTTSSQVTTSGSTTTSSQVTASGSTTTSSQVTTSVPTTSSTTTSANKPEEFSGVANVDKGSLGFNQGSIKATGDVKNLIAVSSYEAVITQWTKTAGFTYNVYYKNAASDEYIKVENELIREFSDGTYRADILGLKANETFDVKIVPVSDGTEIHSASAMAQCKVNAYDRSGYAHFNYNEGVGAYNDDGTLKDDAIILYVNDDNKNTVTLEYNGVSVSGIGNILNSVGQECNEVGHEGQCKKVASGKTYYGKANSNKGILKMLADDNIPLVVRFVGTVSDSGLYKQGKFNANSTSLIEGLTEYDTVNYGGSDGDNGHMARMKSAKNVTLEGVGSDAVLDGWGVHFICESSATNLGKNFEVRNLTFMNTPEDAIGMEGQQEGSKITASVERCFVHHNTFLKPDIGSPAESDKSEGDGSCDFKRGMYFTMSYNYFEYCHKTNLIGSSDSSLQYNISFHHNFWYQCGSRIPLLRQANVHFYNNYILGDQTDSASELSYVSSLRANCYMYTEFNYYDGCKQVFETKSGGAAKGYENIFSQCQGANAGLTTVTNRETEVSNSCSYNGVSYKTFDTSTSQFYYDSENHRSNCYLTDAVTARQEVILFAGSQYRTLANNCSVKSTNVQANMYTPQSSIIFNEDDIFNITLPTAKGSSAVQNLYFNGVTGVTSTTFKFKGQGITFKLDEAAILSLTLSASTAGYSDGYVLSSTGELVLNGSGSVTLKPGTYFVASVLKDKETTVSAFTLSKVDSKAREQMNFATCETAFANLPGEAQYNDDYKSLIKAARLAYNALTDEQKSSFDEQLLISLEQRYLALGIAHVENLISEIGNVDENSGKLIENAKDAYDDLVGYEPSVVISNYNLLVSALEAFEEYAVVNVINLIDAIGTVSLESVNNIKAARLAYNALTSDQKLTVTNYEILLDAEDSYALLVKTKVVEDFITAVNNIKANEELVLADLTEINNLIDIYNSFDEEQLQILNSDEYINKLNAAALYINSSFVTTETVVFDVSKITDTSIKSGTLDGFKYTSNGFDSGFMKIKSSASNSIEYSGLDTASIKMSVIAKIVDTNNADKLCLVVTYADNTSETLTYDLPKNKAQTTLNIEINSTKMMTSVSIKGLETSTSKNAGISYIELTYNK